MVLATADNAVEQAVAEEDFPMDAGNVEKQACDAIEDLADVAGADGHILVASVPAADITVGDRVIPLFGTRIVGSHGFLTVHGLTSPVYCEYIDALVVPEWPEERRAEFLRCLEIQPPSQLHAEVLAQEHCSPKTASPKDDGSALNPVFRATGVSKSERAPNDEMSFRCKFARCRQPDFYERKRTTNRRTILNTILT